MSAAGNSLSNYILLVCMWSLPTFQYDRLTDLYKLVLDILVSLKFKMSRKIKRSYWSKLMCFQAFLLRGKEQLTPRQCLYFPFHYPPPPNSPQIYSSLYLILMASAGLFFGLLQNARFLWAWRLQCQDTSCFLLHSKCYLLQQGSEKQPLFTCYLIFAEPAGQEQRGCLPGSQAAPVCGWRSGWCCV